MKKIPVIILIIATLLLAMSATAFAITTSQHTTIVDSYIGSSSSQSTASEPMDYISCSTHLYNDGVQVATNMVQYWVAMTVGPVNARKIISGDKMGKGYHTYAKSSAGFSRALWTVDYE